MQVKVGGAWKNVSGAFVKVGGAWKQVFPGSANFSNTATGTYSSGGLNYKYIRYESSSTLTITEPGIIEFAMVGGGGGGDGGAPNVFPRAGGGGVFRTGSIYLNTGTITVTIGAAGGGGVFAQSYGAAGGTTSISGVSPLNVALLATGSTATSENLGGRNADYSTSGRGGAGAGGAGSGNNAGIGVTSSITGSSYVYGPGAAAWGGTTVSGGVGSGTPGSAATNFGGGGGGSINGFNGAAGKAGVVIFRVVV